MSDALNCHACRTPAKFQGDMATGYIDCPRCGPWIPASDGKTRVRDIVAPNGVDHPNRRARLSQILRRQQRPGGPPHVLWLKDFNASRLDGPRPTPAAMLDEVVLWLADRQENYAEYVELPDFEVSAWIGAPVDLREPDSTLYWLLATRAGERFVKSVTQETVGLSFEGWARAEELRSVGQASRTAFMAMKFADAELDGVLATCFKPAAAAAGYDLRTVAEGQAAGLIDDQMRVGLRQARFVVADLTHASRGAYWEAGFAEGAGKPVIYTCRLDHWTAENPHFDTNHLATIIWNPEDLARAAAALTAMIRATLPAEAVLDS